jgi:DNA-binding transcriptional LysR family regulator
MELRQMEYFVALAEEQQFTRAAELTMVSQSGLSAAIRGLEEDLQTQLFLRTTRKVELTDAGHALLPFARSLLTQAAAGRDAVIATKADLGGRLRVGSEQCLGVLDVPELLERFHRRYAQVEIEFEQAGSQTLLAELRAGELDVAFIAGPDSGSPTHQRFGTFEHVQLSSEPLVLLAPPDSHLATKTRIDWACLDGVAFIDFHPSWAARMLNDEAFEARGVRRRVKFTVNDVHTLLDMVRRGLGVALVPRPIASKPQAAELAALRLVDPAAPRWVVTAVAGAYDRSAPAASKLMEMLPGRDG